MSITAQQSEGNGLWSVDVQWKVGQSGQCAKRRKCRWGGGGGGVSCARCIIINKSVKKQGLDVRWGGDPIPVHIIYTSCLHWDSEAKNG